MGAEEQGVAASRHRYQMIPRVLVFITHGDKVLLIKGAADKRVWPNLYNGIGGHVERGETIDQAARREILEETGLKNVEELQLRGVTAIDANDTNIGIMLFVFTAVSATNEVVISREGGLEWVDWHTLKPQSMVPDLPMLLSRVLKMHPGELPFFARYWYDQAGQLRVEFSAIGEES